MTKGAKQPAYNRPFEETVQTARGKNKQIRLIVSSDVAESVSDRDLLEVLTLSRPIKRTCNTQSASFDGRLSVPRGMEVVPSFAGATDRGSRS